CWRPPLLTIRPFSRTWLPSERARSAPIRRTNSAYLTPRCKFHHRSARCLVRVIIATLSDLQSTVMDARSRGILLAWVSGILLFYFALIFDQSVPRYPGASEQIQRAYRVDNIGLMEDRALGFLL